MPRPPKDFEELFDKRRDAQRHGLRDSKERAPGERPSWREIDKKRDGSTHTQQGRDPRDQPKESQDRWQSAQAQKERKGALEGLFKDKGADDLKKTVMQAADRAALQAALDAYIEKRGAFAADPELLEKALDARKDATVGLAVDAIAAGIAGFDAAAKKLLLLKLRGKSRTVFDSKVAGRIRALLERHGEAG
jgi:hypothetical protein